MLPLDRIEILEYLDPRGRSPYAAWFDSLNAPAAAKVAIAVARLQQGNFSKVKAVGCGVMEYKIDFGPGYRLYFGKDGDFIVILLGGGTKHRRKRISTRRSRGGQITSTGKCSHGVDSRF